MVSIILSALSLYGISRIITVYDGAFGVFLKLRIKFPNSPLSCTVCTSVWLAIPIALYTGIGLIGYLSIIGIVVLIEAIW